MAINFTCGKCKNVVSGEDLKCPVCDKEETITSEEVAESKPEGE